jgi:hypothetical protein
MSTNSSVIALLVAICMSICAKPAEAQPIDSMGPRPLTVHHNNPDITLRTTTFVCGGVESRFTLRFGVRGFEEFASASRGDERVLPPELRKVTQALLSLDAIYTIIPRCAVGSNELEVLARKGRRQTTMRILWRDGVFEISPYQIEDFLPQQSDLRSH